MRAVFSSGIPTRQLVFIVMVANAKKITPIIPITIPTILNSVAGNFNNNYIVVNNSEAFGGAIYNNGTISTINGNFIGNHIAQDNSDTVTAHGGAITVW